MNRNNHESLGLSEVIPCHQEFDSLFVGSVLNRVWKEFVVSQRVGPLTLPLIQFTAVKPDWERCRLLSCQWKQVWHTCTHFLCTNTTTNTLAGLSRSLLLAGSHTKLTQSCLHYNKHLAPCYLSCTHYRLHIAYTLTFSFPVFIAMSFFCIIQTNLQQMVLLFVSNTYTQTFLLLLNFALLYIDVVNYTYYYNVAIAIFWHSLYIP